MCVSPERTLGCVDAAAFSLCSGLFFGRAISPNLLVLSPYFGAVNSIEQFFCGEGHRLGLVLLMAVQDRVNYEWCTIVDKTLVVL